MSSVGAKPAKPTAVKWILGLTWFRLAMYVLGVVLALTFLSPMHSEWAEGVRRGWIERSGHSLADYGPRQAGAFAGAGFISAVLAVLLLYFVRVRKLLALQIVAAVSVLVSLAHPLALLFTAPVLALTFTAATRAYCQGSSPPAGAPGAA